MNRISIDITNHLFDCCIIKALGRVSLRAILIVPFVLQIFLVIGLTAWISCYNSQQVMNGLMSQLQREVGDRIQQELSTYLATPHLVNQLNADAMRLGQLSGFQAQDPTPFERHLWQQIQRFDAVGTIAIANQQGGLVGASRCPDGSFLVYDTANFTQGTLSTYTTDAEGERLATHTQLPHFDARQRPWYAVHAQTRQASWSEIYRLVSQPHGLGLSAGLPYYNTQGQLQGVFVTDIVLSHIDEFLSSIDLRSGNVFVMDRKGLLVATSTQSPSFIQDNQQLRRLAAIDSDHPLIRATAEKLVQEFSGIDSISNQQQFHFTLSGKEKQFVQVQPFQDRYGLDWLVVTVLPQSAFMSEMDISTRLTFLLCLLALGGAIALGLLAYQWIAQPILQLSQASEAIARGEFEHQLPSQTPIIELAIMAQSFNKMIERLQQSFDQIRTALRASEDKFTKIFRSSPDPIRITTVSEGRYVEVNESFSDLSGYTRDEVIGKTSNDLRMWVKPEDREHFRHLLEIEGLVRNLELEYRAKSGEIRISLLSAEVIDIDGEACILSVTKDITERKRAEEALQKQAQKEQAFNRVIQAIRSSLDLETIFSTAAVEIAQFLQVDRVEIIRYLPERKIWLNVADYRQHDELPSAAGLEIPDEQNPVSEQLKQLQVVQIDDISTWTDDISCQFAHRYPGAWLIAPLHFGDQTWGALSLSKTQLPYSWQASEVELVDAVADQLAIAIHQSQLYQQVQQLNANLETLVHDRTAQLQRSLRFEALLKRITDKVRDSLDEAQILQTAVQELAWGLGTSACDAGLYDLEQQISTIAYEWVAEEMPPARGCVLSLSDYPELYQALLQGHHLHFCWLHSKHTIRPITEQCTTLAYPVMGNQGVIGDLWLYKRGETFFEDLEIRLVQQVANQCAIAIRQSRLFRATQAQVAELERLNGVKDDFLSTVSHELRSPMSNIKMATQMLEITLKRKGLLDLSSDRITQYFQILKDECQRETSLINDLLDLSRLDVGTEPLILTTLYPEEFIPRLAEPFRQRTRHQHQQFELQLCPNLPCLITDQSDLERILSELLHNACKYTPAGEKITLSACTHHRDEAPLPPTCLQNASAKFIQISVSNTGVEIPDAERDRIFEKFYRIPNNDPWKHGGTGLGLALAKKLVERLGGAIEVDSDATATTFTVILPTLIQSATAKYL
jgi:PAS domain S-box-containing protein